ncbi:helix-turn-helix domain-containing protein [Parabacteroides sp.]
MKAFYLFLSLFIYASCISHEKNDLLEKELTVTPLLSASFDSLWQNVQKLPPQQQIAILLYITNKDEKEIGGMQKQKRLLQEGFPLASKKNKKKILLRFLEIYKELAEQKEHDAITKGLLLSEDLETNYSLSQEEKWKIKKTKAILLGRMGLHKQYLPIWFELLTEHRTAHKTELVIEDLCALANHFVILGNEEKGISLYKEACQLAIENQLPDLSKQCLIRLIYIFHDSKHYTEIVDYSNQIGIDSMALFMPSIYSILSTCYLKLQKTDSARFYLTKIDHTLNAENGLYYNCNIAETYIAENRGDSALIFLKKAINQFKNQTKRFSQKNIKASLPFYFLSSYSSLATLYQQNGNYQQASKAFSLVEPLMKKSINNPNQLEKQANALARYSSFCRATKQYEKAVDLLMRRDSILQIVNNINKERESKNLIDRLQIKDLEYQINMQEVSLTNSHRMIAAISACALLFFLLICAIAYIYYQRKKRLTIIINQEKEREKEAKQSELSATSKNKKTLSPEEKLFRAAQKKVKSEKLYLQKDIKLETLAQELETNRSYLSSCINTCSGKNFNQWINDFRIDFLLEHIHSGEKLTELAAKAGFTSIDAFYRNFKRKTKLTPNEYLKRFN